MDDAERDVRILALIQGGEDELRVAGQALAEGRPHLCASRSCRAMHAMVAAVRGAPGPSIPPRPGHAPGDKAQAALKNAHSVCCTFRDALTKWKQGRALI